MANIFDGYKKTFQAPVKSTIVKGTVASGSTKAVATKQDYRPMAVALSSVIAGVPGEIAATLFAPKGGTTTVSPSVSTSPKTVVKTLTAPQKEAIQWQQQQKLGTALLSTPHSQKVVSTLKAAQISATLQTKGYSMVPTSDVQGLYTEAEKAKNFADQLNILRGQQEQLWSENVGYQQKISQYSQELAVGTNKAAILQGQLSDTQSMYETLLGKYNTLLNQGGGGTGGGGFDFGSIDWKQIGLLAALAIGGIMLFGAVLKKI